MWGAPDAVVQEWKQALLAAQRAATVAVWPEHWHAVCVFRAMARQWCVVAGAGGAFWQGLRYEALPVAAAGVKASVPDALRQPLGTWFAHLQVLEAAAAPLLNRRSAA